MGRSSPMLKMSSDSDLERSGRLSFKPWDSTRKCASSAVFCAVVAGVTEVVEGREVFKCSPVAELGGSKKNLVWMESRNFLR